MSPPLRHSMWKGGGVNTLRYKKPDVELAPFPAVETDARRNANWHYREESFVATITASTTFVMFVPDGVRDCVLNVTHEPPCYALSKNTKRMCVAERANRTNGTDAAGSTVTIDSLSAWCGDELE